MDKARLLSLVEGLLDKAIAGMSPIELVEFRRLLEGNLREDSHNPFTLKVGDFISLVEKKIEPRFHIDAMDLIPPTPNRRTIVPFMYQAPKVYIDEQDSTLAHLMFVAAARYRPKPSIPEEKKADIKSKRKQRNKAKAKKGW